MSNIKINISRQVFNDCYLPFLKDKSRYHILYGGAGSGKSYFIAQKLIFQHLKQKGKNTLVVRKVASSNRDSTFPLLQQVISSWKLDHLFQISLSDMTITCVNGNQIKFKGLDNVEKIKSITFKTGILTDIWIEEASEVLESDFQQLDLRLRGNSSLPFQIIFSFNPVSATHWLKRYFFDKPKDNSEVLQTTYLDNKFIDDSYKIKMEQLKDEDLLYYQVYALGEWGQLGNKVYTKYVVKDLIGEIVLNKLAQEQVFDQIYWGLDFGFNHPSALIKVGYKDDELYILDELYREGLTNTELIEEAKKIVDKDEIIIADSAEPARIKEFKAAGFKIRAAKKGKNSVKEGIEWIRRRMIYIDEKCHNFYSEIDIYSYKLDKYGNPTEEPVNFKDDAMAALRYAVEPLRRDKTFTILK